MLLGFLHGDGTIAQLVECLLSTYRALSSSPTYSGHKGTLPGKRQEDQEFKVTLYYVAQVTGDPVIMISIIINVKNENSTWHKAFCRKEMKFQRSF